MTLDLPAIDIRNEADIVHARSIARQVAEVVGFSAQARTAIATSVSEIARNAYNYGGGGTVCFQIVEQGVAPSFRIVVADHGPGIADPEKILNGEYRSPTGMGMGIVGARRLMDSFEIAGTPGGGTTIIMARRLPAAWNGRGADELKALVATEHDRADALVPAVELREQNRELVILLQELQIRQDELNRLNQELEDTNRGVVALYAELDERANSLRQANDLKTRFLSHMSHEFRTPLNSIAALSRLLLEHADGPLGAEQEIQVEYIRRAADELTSLVNDLLDLAKVEAGKIEIYPTSFEVADLFGSLRGMLRPLFVNDAVELVFDVSEIDFPLVTDEGKLAQILRNFISNALKFTERGEVRVTAYRAENAMVRFDVSDTGIGIAPEDQEQIFQEFTQIDSTLQKHVKGTGLGLPLSRKLAELLGGDVAVESVHGIGSTFSVTIPAAYRREGSADAAMAEPAAPVRAGIVGEGDTILLIDDDVMARYLFRQLLSTTGYEVIEAGNGTNGLEVARTQKPSLIVLDKCMPDLDGIDVLRRLRTEERTRDIPVIFSSSAALDDADRQAIEKAGAVILAKDLLTRGRVLDAIKGLKERE